MPRSPKEKLILGGHLVFAFISIVLLCLVIAEVEQYFSTDISAISRRH